MRKHILLMPFLLLVVLLQGCAGGVNATATERRVAIDEMQQQVLQQLYQEKASARQEVQSAPGYGVVTDNRSGHKTYMKMGEVGLGLGAGVKDFRLVIIFHNERSMTRFIEDGWAFGAQADAAAKAGDKGGAVGAEASVNDMTIYQFTEAGLALQATIKGTKFWVDTDLN